MMFEPQFLSGMITAVFGICALFFARFWTQTRDTLFAGYKSTA